MRKGFVDILLILFLIFVAPIMLLISMQEDHNEQIIKDIQNGHAIVCNIQGENSVTIKDFDGYNITENAILTPEGKSYALFHCDTVIEL